MAKIRGVKSAAGDILRCPPGYYIQVWSHLEKNGDISLYTSEASIYTVWTSGVPAGDRMVPYQDYNPRWSLSDRIRAAVADVWRESQ